MGRKLHTEPAPRRAIRRRLARAHSPIRRGPGALRPSTLIFLPGALCHSQRKLLFPGVQGSLRGTVLLVSRSLQRELSAISTGGQRAVHSARRALLAGGLGSSLGGDPDARRAAAARRGPTIPESRARAPAGAQMRALCYIALGPGGRARVARTKALRARCSPAGN